MRRTDRTAVLLALAALVLTILLAFTPVLIG